MAVGLCVWLCRVTISSCMNIELYDAKIEKTREYGGICERKEHIKLVE